MKNKILDVLQKIAQGFLAGMLISIGGAAFLACYDANKYVGALLFTIALLCICIKSYSLYTGKIGYVLSKHSKEDISVLLLGLLGNVLATTAFGYLAAWALPSLKETALRVCEAKLGQSYPVGLARGFFCGILVYLAVDVYRKDRSVLAILIGIPAFILSGYEHSIADMFYFAASGILSLRAFGYLWMIVIGNSLGALIIPALLLIQPKKPQGQEQAQAQEQEPGPSDASAPEEPQTKSA